MRVVDTNAEELGVVMTKEEAAFFAALIGWQPPGPMFDKAKERGKWGKHMPTLSTTQDKDKFVYEIYCELNVALKDMVGDS